MKSTKKKFTIIMFSTVTAFFLLLGILSSLQILNERYWAREMGIHRLERSFIMEVEETDQRFSVTSCLIKKATFQTLTYSDLIPDIKLVPTEGKGDVPSTEQCLKNFNDNLYKNPDYNSLRIRLETEGYIQAGEKLSLDTLLNQPQKVYKMIEIAVDDGYDITTLTKEHFHKD